jgi:hypothetical protein
MLEDASALAEAFPGRAPAPSLYHRNQASSQHQHRGHFMKGTPEAVAAHMKNEIPKWRAELHKAKIKAE